MNDDFRREVEAASLRSWPSIDSRQIGSWLLRIGDGYSKRANSATYRRDGGSDVARDTSACEKQFALSELRPLFRLPDFAKPQNADEFLANRGYELIDPTLVLVRPTRGLVAEPSEEIALFGVERWRKSFANLNSLSRTQAISLDALLARIIGRCIFAGILENDTIAAVALGVIDGRHLGIFDLVTDPTKRRRGYASRLIRGIIARSLEFGADRAYLQVVEANETARRLYSSLEFEQAYRYWYRAAPPDAYPSPDRRPKNESS